MSRPKSKISVVCQNKNCSFYQKEQGKDITKQGKNYAGHQRYLCKHCHVAFVETKGTPLYCRKFDERKIKQLCKELVEKKGIRAVERTMHIHRDTIGSYLSALAEHAVMISKYMTTDLKLSAYEVDEIWTFVKKNKKKLSPIARKNLNMVTAGDSHV